MYTVVGGSGVMTGIPNGGEDYTGVAAEIGSNAPERARSTAYGQRMTAARRVEKYRRRSETYIWESVAVASVAAAAMASRRVEKDMQAIPCTRAAGR